MNARRHGGWVILLSFAVALLLAVFPLPLWLGWARPEFVALALIYWVIALPQRVGMVAAFGLGLVLDILEGAVPGQMVPIEGSRIHLHGNFCLTSQAKPLV